MYRYCFLWNGAAFHIDEYLSPVTEELVMRCYCEGDPVLPDSLSAALPPPLSLATGGGAASELSAYAISLRGNSAALSRTSSGVLPSLGSLSPTPAFLMRGSSFAEAPQGDSDAPPSNP